MGSIIALSPNGFQVVSYDTLSWVTVRFKRLWVCLVHMFKNWKFLFKNIYGNTCGWKNALKYIKCYLKTENGCLKSLTKHPLYLLDPTLPVIKILNYIPYIISQSNGQETRLKWRISQSIFNANYNLFFFVGSASLKSPKWSWPNGVLKERYLSLSLNWALFPLNNRFGFWSSNFHLFCNLWFFFLWILWFALYCNNWCWINLLLFHAFECWVDVLSSSFFFFFLVPLTSTFIIIFCIFFFEQIYILYFVA